MGSAWQAAQLTTGIAGLDDVLSGGFSAGGIFLVEGEPGSGKTTLALQFLLAGAAAGEQTLHITLSETEQELRAGAASHHWSLTERVGICELMPAETLLKSQQEQTLLYASDLELGAATQQIFQAVDRVKPTRLVIDSLSEIRLMAQSSLRYRREILTIKHRLAQSSATVLLLDDLTADTPDKTLHSVAHGVLQLQQIAPDYGAERRRLRVLKYRGRKYRGGYHDVTIGTGGLNVFPRLIASEHRTQFLRQRIATGIGAFDELLGGGVDAGSSTLLIGPAGSGKSLIVVTFAVAAIRRGEKAALFIFDEELGLLCDRMRGMGIDLEGERHRGNLRIEQIDAAELSPGEFAHRVRKIVDAEHIKTVVIDSLNGYQAAMPAENALLHIHELLQYLNRQGVASFLTLAQHGMIGNMSAPLDVTYLADTVLFLRFFEARGHVRRAISCLKKRTGSHETSIREYHIGNGGVIVDAPLTDFQGVLQGVPNFVATTGVAASIGRA